MKPIIQKFCDDIKFIKYRNAGGCLLFAYAFWLWLKTNGESTDSFQIVQYTGSYEPLSLEINLNYIENRGYNPDSVSSSAHFTWLYEGVEYDSDGVYNTSMAVGKRTVLYGLNTSTSTCLVEPFCINALLKGWWNDMFNRKNGLVDIQQALEIKFPKELFCEPPEAKNTYTKLEIHWGWWD